MRIIYVFIVMTLMTALTVTTQGCGLENVGKSCTTIAIPSICLKLIDPRGQTVTDDQIEIFAAFNGNAETRQQMLAPSCVSTLPYPKGPVTYELRLVTKGKEYKKTVEVKFDGCHPITETVTFVID